MNCILAIDLSTPRGHIAVAKAGQVIYEQDFTSHRSHNSMLYGPLSIALEAAGKDLNKIAIGTGPGSYTGVRISIAAAHGVALSRGLQVVGLPSLTAVSQLPEFLVVGDARRGKYYAGRISDRKLKDGLLLLEESELRIWRQQNSALDCFTTDPVVPLELPAVVIAQPSAALLALHAGDECPEPGVEIEPIYVQDAFITKAKTPTMGTQV